MKQWHRDNARAQEMFAKVEKFLAGDLSQLEFCRAEGLRYSTFSYWYKQHQRRQELSTSPIETPTDFIPLRVVPSEPVPNPPSCVIEYPSGVVVRLNGPMDAAMVAELIHTTKE